MSAAVPARRPSERPPAAAAASLLVDGGYALLGGLLAVVAAWPIYAHPQALLAGGVGVVLGVGIAIAGRALRLPWWVDALTTFAIYLVIAVPLAVPSLLSAARYGEGLLAAIAGIVVGWRQLVTLELPIGDYEAVLVPLLIVAMFGALLAARIAVTARSRAVLAPLVLAAMLGFGIAFGTGAVDDPFAPGILPSLPVIGTPTVGQVLVVLALLLVLLTVGWLAILGRRGRRARLARAVGLATTRVVVSRGSGWAVLRRTGLGAGMVLLALLAAVGVAVPGLALDRSVIRDGVRPVELAAMQVSPLSGYRSWFDTAAYTTPLFTVAAPPGVDRLRIAVMDDYDGTRFAVGEGTRFLRLPGGAAAGGSRVTLTIGDGYGLPWVPIPGDVRGRVGFEGASDRALALQRGLYYAADRSDVVTLPTDETAAGLRAGDVVTVAGQVVGDAAALLRAAAPSGGLHGIDETSHPALTQWISMQSPTAGGAGLLRLIDALRSRGYLSHGLLLDASASSWVADLGSRVPGFAFEPSRSGHSVARIEALFTQLIDRQREAGDAGLDGDQAPYVAAVGDDEQFAVAAALIAWAQGFDARVVLGVHLGEGEGMLPPGGGPAAVPACDAVAGGYRCEGRNVAAWIEVRAGDVWVPVETSPQVVDPPQAPNEGELPPPHGTQPEQPAVDTLDPPSDAAAGADSAPPEAAAPPLSSALHPVLRLAGLGGGALLLLLLPPAVLLLAKRLRRARRRVADPELAIVGAWDEFLDGCIDLGVVEVPRGTRRQIATAVGSPTAAQLAAVADLAVFGETAPSASQRELAWSLLEIERAAMRREVPFMRRLRAALAPASFLWRIGERSSRRSGGRVRRAR